MAPVANPCQSMTILFPALLGSAPIGCTVEPCPVSASSVQSPVTTAVYAHTQRRRDRLQLFDQYDSRRLGISYSGGWSATPSMSVVAVPELRSALLAIAAFAGMLSYLHLRTARH